MADEEKKMNQLSELQMKMLDMLKWFQNFCKQNNISYYAVGGTMLGAIRHNGFIPWDDDIDVGIPRKDFEHMLEISKLLKCGVDRYIIESFENGNDDFEYAYAKVYDTQTTLVENRKKKQIRGIFIDVFPLDGIGESKKEALKNFKPIKYRLDLLALKSCGIRKGRSFYKNIAVSAAVLLPDRLYGTHKIIGQITDLCKKHDFEKCAFVGNLVGNWREKEIMERDNFGVARAYPFEDTVIMGVENYDAYLTCLYGNWKQLPLPEKQISNHDFVELD